MARKRKISEIPREEWLDCAAWAEQKGDIPLAIYYLKNAIKKGSNIARGEISRIYDDVIEPSNPERAVYWSKQALKHGDIDAAWNLAMHYAGLGRKRGYLYWLNISNNLGDADASKELITREWWTKRRTQRVGSIKRRLRP